MISSILAAGAAQPLPAGGVAPPAAPRGAAAAAVGAAPLLAWLVLLLGLWHVGCWSQTTALLAAGAEACLGPASADGDGDGGQQRTRLQPHACTCSDHDALQGRSAGTLQRAGAQEASGLPQGNPSCRSHLTLLLPLTPEPS